MPLKGVFGKLYDPKSYVFPMLHIRRYIQTYVHVDSCIDAYIHLIPTRVHTYLYGFVHIQTFITGMTRVEGDVP